MSEFINTIDTLGDDAVMDSLIDGSITEFKDDEITTIGNYAFYGKPNLEIVDVPNVTTIDNYAFSNCSSLLEVNAPNTVSLGVAFANCSKLLKVSFPLASGFHISHEFLFKGCSSLYSVDLPKLNLLPNSSFEDCTSLKQIRLPNIKDIRNYVFRNSGLKALILPNSSYLFSTISTVAFSGSHIASGGSGYIYVPRALVDTYKSATNWTTVASQIRAIEDWTVDGTVTGDMREYCEGITLDTTELTFTDANSQTITATGVFGIFDTMVWSCSDGSVARVNNGVVTPISDGTAIITVTCGDHSATCTVTVNAGLESTNILYNIGFNSGYLNGNTGAAAGATSDLYTDKFDISMYAGNPINVQLTNVTTIATNSRMCYYTTDNTFISSVNGVSGGSGIVNMASTVPSNAVYAAISIAKNNNFSINITCDSVTIGTIDYTS